MNVHNGDGGGSGLHVVFGSGPVGLTLTDALVGRGQTVRLVNRSGKASVPAGVEVRGADATDPGQAVELTRDAQVIYHCMNVPYREQYEIIPRMQKALIAGASASGASLVVTDTLYMYGVTHGRPMTEDTPYAPTSRKGQMRGDVARAYLAAHNAGDIRVALGRAADFYGPRVLNSALGERVFPPLLQGKAAQVLGNVSLPHSFSYIKDVARGLETLGEREDALGREWLLPVAPTVTTEAMVRRIADCAGTAPRLQALPKIAVQALGLFDAQLSELVEMFYQYTEPQIVDSSGFEARFGWGATPLDIGIRETVEWFRGQQA